MLIFFQIISFIKNVLHNAPVYNVCGHRIWLNQVNVGYVAKNIFVSHKTVHYSLLDLECTVLVSVVISLKQYCHCRGKNSE